MLKALKRLFVLALLMVLATGGWLLGYGKYEKTLAAPRQFTLKQGSSLRGAARQMSDAGVLAFPSSFEILGRLSGHASRIQAGNYEVTGAVSPLGLLDMITSGAHGQDKLAIIEGWTLGQLRAALNEHPALKHDTVGIADAAFAQRLGIAQSSAEGWFLPDTYFFPSGASDLSVLQRAHRAMENQLKSVWENRAAGLPFAEPYEALIMASIVEKETGQAAERPLIAAVFVNRLKAGMKLQTDPTVIYGLGSEFDGNLRKRDLLADGPYNSYTRTGLPPTPIAMPGVASLVAATNPAQGRMLYFVSRGDGTSHFSNSLAEHERAVTKYQRRGAH